MRDIQTATCDVLVIGGGLAGLQAALSAYDRGVDVLVVSKGSWSRSGASALATPGFAAAIGHADSRDNPEIHAADTVRSGCGIGRSELVEIMCAESADRLIELEKLGVEFEKDDDLFIQYRGGGHTYPRSCTTVQKLRRGILAPLARIVRQSSIQIIENTSCLELIQEDGEVRAALCVNNSHGGFLLVTLSAVVIATGGLGQIYKYTSNPKGLYGEGIMLAHQAGASLVDMEFVQFRPFRLISPPILRGKNLASSTFEYGATIRNAEGNDLIELLTNQGRVPTRDEISRLIANEVYSNRGVIGGVQVDLRRVQMDKFLKLNPSINHLVSKRRLDISRERLVVSPEAHYFMGGVEIDRNGCTTIPGLYAVGEAVGGIHGANRLQDNAFPELFVFGKRVGQSTSQEKPRIPENDISSVKAEVIDRWRMRMTPHRFDKRKLSAILMELRTIMWENAGVIRTADGLGSALARLDELRDELEGLHVGLPNDLAAFAEVKQGVEAAILICTAARRRNETRGAHTRNDYPFQKDALSRSFRF